MKNDPPKSIYKVGWDKFYSQQESSDQKPLWDVNPEYSIKLDHEIFKSYFDENLPIIDFGCGTGIQSLYLSNHFSKVLGLDASKIIIEKNKDHIFNENISFDLYDGLDSLEAKRYHDQHGDANIYVRGVLHQVKQEHRKLIVKSFKELMGKRGRLYIVETLPDMKGYLLRNSEKFTALPLPIQKVFLSDLMPTGISVEEMATLFSNEGFDVLDNGELSLNTRLCFSSGQQIQMPSSYFIIKTSNFGYS